MQSSKKNFARGSTDSFYFPKLPYLGNLSQIRVYIEPKGAQLVCAGWDLETVTVTHVPTNTTWAAYHGNRIDKNCGHMAILTPMPGVLSYGEHNEGVAPEGNDHGSDVRRKAPSN